MSITFSLTQLLEGFVSESEVIDFDVKVTGLAWDSRKVKSGDLFFACDGEVIHGKQFIQAAVDAGASAIALEGGAAEALALSEQYQSLPIIAVAGLTKKLGYIAARFYGEPSKKLSLVGVTGTNGKTSITHFLAQCLNSESAPCGVIGTMGAGLWGELSDVQNTTPGAVELQQWFFGLSEQRAKYVAMEVSSHGLTQGRTVGCAFDMAVFTNLTQDHLDYHGDMKAYGEAKLTLFRHAGLSHVVLNLDDEFSRDIINILPSSVKIIGITLNPVKRNHTGVCVIYGKVESLGGKGMRVLVESELGNGQFTTHLLGDFNASNLLAVLACAVQLDFSFDDVCQKISQINAPGGRLEKFGGGNQPLVVVDYAHTPDALKKVLETLKAHTAGKLFVLLGCGGDRDKAKRPKMGAIAEAHADVVWLTNDNPRTEAPALIIDDILKGVSQPEHVVVETNRELAIRQIVSEAKAADVVLIAGKGHENYQIIGNQRTEFSDRKIVADMLGEAA